MALAALALLRDRWQISWPVLLWTVCMLLLLPYLVRLLLYAALGWLVGRRCGRLLSLAVEDRARPSAAAPPGAPRGHPARACREPARSTVEVAAELDAVGVQAPRHRPWPPRLLTTSSSPGGTCLAKRERTWSA